MAKKGPDAWRPSKQLEALLMGRVAWDDAPEAIRSWARFPIYQAAAQICALPSKGERRNALGKIPAAIRPKVENEVRRIFPLKRR